MLIKSQLESTSKWKISARKQKAKIIDPHVDELTSLLNENKKNWHT